jgi:hypothetical protein
MLVPGSPFASYADMFSAPPEDASDKAASEEHAAIDKPLTILGETFPRCSLSDGLVAYFDAVAKELEAAGYGGKRVLQADLFSTVQWVYGNFPPLKGGAPWSYGTDAGLKDAEYFLVPFCPLHPPARKLITEAVLAHKDYTLTYETRTPLFVLYRVTGP